MRRSEDFSTQERRRDSHIIESPFRFIPSTYVIQ
jgi:hypothetical protein